MLINKIFILIMLILMLTYEGIAATFIEDQPPFIDTDISTFTEDPIAIIGHGSFLDKNGNDIKATPQFIVSAQKYYIDLLTPLLDEKLSDEFKQLRSRFTQGEKLALINQSEQVFVNAVLINHLVAKARIDDGGEILGKNKLLKTKFEAGLLIENNTLRDRVRLDVLNALPKLTDFQNLFSTMNSGAAYIAECLNAGVPTPPDWGSSQWHSTGSLSDSQEFITRGLTAKPYIYTSNAANSLGSCIALPRENSAGTAYPLLGIICVGESGKACFWDNQSNNVNFDIAVGTSVPLSSFAGGAELFGGTGGACTKCHAGENPFTLHPNTALGHSALDSTPAGSADTMPSVWHEPLVHPDWPQNAGPGTLAAQPEAATCTGCHSSSFGGRFPKLSTEYRNGYCTVVLKNAINIAAGDPANTMPLGSILGNTAHSDLVSVIDDFCDGDPANAEGDPHIKTTDKVNYDFQASGEFTLLKGFDNFEVQVRNRAIPTSFFPGQNSHTELATCVSSISAVATQVGTDRVSYQPRLDGIPDPSGLKLHVNGLETAIPATGLTLSGGGTITQTVANGIEIIYPKGEVMSITPYFWSSQSQWMLNVSVSEVEANRGIMGKISLGGWLPVLPDGTSMGSKPANVAQRYEDLNRKFADAWRVTSSNSLFDYALGQSSTDFTLSSWPKNMPPCELPNLTLAPSSTIEIAEKVCSNLKDNDRRENCVFDVVATGEPDLAEHFLATERIETNSTQTQVKFREYEEDKTRSAVFVAKVKLRRSSLKQAAQGTVQFFIDNKPEQNPIQLDALGRAVWKPKNLDFWKRGQVVTAQYLPDKNSQYLPSISNIIVGVEKDTEKVTLEGIKNHINYFTLKLSEILTVDAFVDYETLDCTAIAGKDYIATKGTATIPAGQQSVTIGVEIIADNITETAEEFSLVLTNPINGIFPPNTTEVTATHRIIDGEDKEDDIVGGGTKDEEITCNKNIDTTPPVITLNGNTTIEIIQGITYTDAGATAIDNQDGSIDVITSGSVDTNTIGNYTLSYTATDQAGNSSTKTRTITVVQVADTTPPVITLNGSSTIEITQGINYTDQGATSIDDRDGTINVITSGSVDSSTLGSYTLTYQAIDQAGNNASISRIVKVVSDIIINNSKLQACVDEQLGHTPSQIELQNLQSLSCRNKSLVDNDIIEISALTTLTFLDLRENRISNLSPFNTLVQLNYLNLRKNRITDVSTLSTLTKLTTLFIGYNQIIDLSALSTLKKLTLLDLYSNQIIDLSTLNTLTELTTLYLAFNKIIDLSALSTLKKLTLLDLNNNQIIDLSSLSTLTKLNALYLSDNQIIDLSVLSTLTELIFISVDNNKIIDISPLSALIQLKSLVIENNNIIDISSLSTLTSLVTLGLSYNKIIDIDSLNFLTQLTSLHLKDNKIINLIPLSSLTELTFLKLDNNQISNVSSLNTLTKLTTLHIANNCITDFIPVNHISSISGNNNQKASCQ